MTGGTVVLLGKCGLNFAAGMSGGIAYVFDKDNSFNNKLNKELVEIESISINDEEILINLIKEHVEATGSQRGREILENWNEEINNFKKIVPNDYKKIITLIDKKKAEGLNHEDALLAAFYERSVM